MDFDSIAVTNAARFSTTDRRTIISNATINAWVGMVVEGGRGLSQYVRAKDEGEKGELGEPAHPT
jgi:hypothetical protein